MTEATGNLWTFEADWRVITTNGTVKTNGRCVMGRGCAREARDRFPGFDLKLGQAIREEGNNLIAWPEEHLITFPVKHEWWEVADILLIERSARQLFDFLGQFETATVVMPRPGCGNGKLSWPLVKPVLAILPDRVTVITFGSGP